VVERHAHLAERLSLAVEQIRVQTLEPLEPAPGLQALLGVHADSERLARTRARREDADRRTHLAHLADAIALLEVTHS
jgi:hypothetical protein